MKIKIRRYVFLPLLAVLLCASAYTPPDEGMYPLSEIKKVNLKEAGLKMDQELIFNPDGISLVDALVRVGGCTGSFISEEGLIITNHHCAFGAVQQASTPENDYLNKGFVARSREQELEAKGLTCRITEGYEDVSDKVLQSVQNVSDPASRIRLIQGKMKQLAAEAEAKDSTIQAEVSEMFVGRAYVLFRYKIIQDVRIVYVPSRNIGEFGGETDNWVWPRHTGDFSFMRAYVAPDGSPAKYAKNNVPYKPKKFLKVNPDGANENDFVFMLGYPGRTFRNYPARFLAYQEKFQLPYISDLYEFENQAMEQAGKKDKATELKLATRMKRNANVLKNYRGKLKGLSSLNLVHKRQTEDEELAKYINSDVELKEKYGNLMDHIDQLYQMIDGDAYRDLWFSQIYNSTSLLRAAREINIFKSAVLAQPQAQRTTFFQDSVKTILGRIRAIYDSYDIDADKIIFAKMLRDASRLPNIQRVNAVDRKVLKGFSTQEQIDGFVDNAFQFTKLKDANYVLSNLLGSYKSLTTYNDPLLLFENDLRAQMLSLQAEKDRREGILNQLMADYLVVKEKFKQQSFIPDANSTLRLTYGYVKGYSPVDASYMLPFTSIKGIIEKGNTGSADFSYPPLIKQLWQDKNFGPYIKKDLGDVPVAFLYDLDTTGGNSGSPVMNANGELVGVNFDRVYEATINDYAWNESYSRSIGVDIRYVLWIASKVDQANFLLDEIGVNL